MQQSFYPQIENRRIRKFKASPVHRREDQCTSIISDILNTSENHLAVAKPKKQNLDLNVTLEVDHILK